MQETIDMIPECVKRLENAVRELDALLKSDEVAAEMKPDSPVLANANKSSTNAHATLSSQQTTAATTPTTTSTNSTSVSK